MESILVFLNQIIMNIINYEHVDALVEIDEIVNGIESGVHLYIELKDADIYNTFFSG